MYTNSSNFLIGAIKVPLNVEIELYHKTTRVSTFTLVHSAFITSVLYYRKVLYLTPW